MEHKNNGHEQEYPLYTERIVPSPKVKYRRLIKTVKILLLIIAIGVIYAVADKIVIPVIMDKIAVRNRVVIMEQKKMEYRIMMKIIIKLLL